MVKGTITIRLETQEETGIESIMDEIHVAVLQKVPYLDYTISWEKEAKA